MLFHFDEATMKDDLLRSKTSNRDSFQSHHVTESGGEMLNPNLKFPLSLLVGHK